MTLVVGTTPATTHRDHTIFFMVASRGGPAAPEGAVDTDSPRRWETADKDFDLVEVNKRNESRVKTRAQRQATAKGRNGIVHHNVLYDASIKSALLSRLPQSDV